MPLYFNVPFSFTLYPSYENQCYRLPVSTGGQIGIVKTSSEITIFVCPGDSDEHKGHDEGFIYLGYGDIVVEYSDKGIITCDGVHVESTNPERSSYDMQPGGIYTVWSI